MLERRLAHVTEVEQRSTRRTQAQRSLGGPLPTPKNRFAVPLVFAYVSRLLHTTEPVAWPRLTPVPMRTHWHQQGHNTVNPVVLCGHTAPGALHQPVCSHHRRRATIGVELLLGGMGRGRRRRVAHVHANGPAATSKRRLRLLQHDVAVRIVGAGGVGRLACIAGALLCTRRLVRCRRTQAKTGSVRGLLAAPLQRCL